VNDAHTFVLKMSVADFALLVAMVEEAIDQHERNFSHYRQTADVKGLMSEAVLIPRLQAMSKQLFEVALSAVGDAE